MSSSKSADHWRHLAEQIGAEVPDEPDEPSAEAEAEQSAHADEQPAGGAKQPGSAQPEVVAESEGTVRKERRREEPRPAVYSPRRPNLNHWRDIAGQLGIELPEPEPEPETMPEPEAETTIEPDSEAFQESLSGREWEPDGDEPAVLETDPDQSEPVSKAADEPARDVEASDSVDPGESSVPSMLFEDPDLLVETPGVLDAVFDEEVADFGETAVEDTVELDEAADEAPEEAAATDDGDDGDEEKRGKRKRRRRRRRPRRDRADSDAEAEQPDVEEACETEAMAEMAEHSRTDEDEDGAPAEPAKKHRKIPTWEEAISVVIDANMEARAKSGGGSRGRGRGRGRR